MYSIVECPDIVVAAAATESPVIRADVVYGDADLVTLMAPAAAEASTIEVTDDPDAAVPAWFALNNQGTAIAGPAASEAEQLTIAAKAFRLKFGAGVAAERTFKMNKRIVLT